MRMRKSTAHISNLHGKSGCVLPLEHILLTYQTKVLKYIKRFQMVVYIKCIWSVENQGS